MPDEQITPEQGGIKSEEASTADSSNEASINRRKPSLGRSLGWWAVCFALAVLVLIIGDYGYLFYANLNPDSGLDGPQVRRVISTASSYLSSDPSVTSAEATRAEANISGSFVTVDAHPKSGTGVEAAVNLLVSTRQKTLQQEPDHSGDSIISVSWTVNGSTIDVDVQYQRNSEAIRIDVKRAFTPAGEAKTLTGSIDTYTKLTIDYGQVAILPISLTQPSVSNSSKTFTMSGWKVTSTLKTDGQSSNPPFDQIVTAVGQTNPIGTIDLGGTTLSIIGLATDENKGLTPEAVAPVVHAIVDCQATGLTTPKLNGKLQKGLSNDNLWITFVCDNGTWASKYDSPSPSDTEIPDKAAELQSIHRSSFASAVSDQTPPSP